MALASLMRRIGWICFGLMFLPIAAAIVPMLGMPSGSYAWDELPLVTQYALPLGGVLALVATALLVGALGASSLAHRRLVARGQLAVAKILSLRETGTTVNRRPLVRLRLEVQPPGQPSFEGETERLISLFEIPQFVPGAMVHVKYDPETREVAILNAQEYERSLR